MFTRFQKPALTAAFLAGLLALAACNKKDDGSGPTGGQSDPRLRAQRQNYLKQIGLGFHNFHDSIGHLPAGFYGPDGKVGLSWRVALLPYLEHENLFRQFRLNEAWDSDHNKKLIPQMPRIYARVGAEGDTQGLTHLRSFAGPGAVMPLNSQVKGQVGQIVRGPRFGFDISDGTSNTLLVAEAAEPVVWTKPDELEFNPGGPLPKLGGASGDGVNVLFCDGSVRSLKADMPPARLKALITYNGGETFTLDD